MRLRGSDALLGIFVAAVVAFSAAVVWSTQHQTPNLSSAAAVTSTPEPTPEPRSLLIVGDSWTAGGPTNTGPEWPALLDLPEDWVTIIDAEHGTGYLGGSQLANGGIMTGRLDDLLTYSPDVAVIALGRNDVARPLGRVLDVAERSLSAMQREWPDAQIVVLSPFSPGPPDEDTVAMTEAMRDLTGRLGLDYVDVSVLISAQDAGRMIENYHPTDAGQRAIAEQVGRALADLGALR